MAASNESGNLMDDFEEAFQNCLLSLTKEEPNVGSSKEDIELEAHKTTNRFLDVARQMEAFFLQKRFLVSTLRPEMLIKDENQDLRIEITRKENLLNKHYNRLEEWKACLSDTQQAQGVHPRPTGGLGGVPQITEMPPGMGGVVPRGGPGMSNMPGGGQMSGSIPPGMVPPGSQQHQMQMQQMRMMAKFSK